mgnify:CR=1 FL=1
MRGREREENKENINEDGTETTFSHSLSLFSLLSLFLFLSKRRKLPLRPRRGFFKCNTILGTKREKGDWKTGKKDFKLFSRLFSSLTPECKARP